MYNQEDTFRKSVDNMATPAIAVAATSLITGLLFANALCDVDLSEWHIINAVLCGALAAACHFGKNMNPRAIQAGFRVSKFEASLAELKAEGLTTAAAAVALAAAPIALLFWAARGFASMGVGICAESAPMFFAISLLLMVSEAAALVYIIWENLKAAGYNLDKAKHFAELAAFRAKTLAVDIAQNGHVYIMKLVEAVVPTIKATIAYVAERAQSLYANRPSWMNPSHWTGSESTYLLR